MAGNVIDLTGKITNDLPMVKINNDLIVTVNNRHSTIMTMQLLVKEQENKSDKNNEEKDEFAFMEKVLQLLLGKKSSDLIKKMDYPFTEYKLIFSAVMAAATGQSLEEAEESAQRFQKK